MAAYLVPRSYAAAGNSLNGLGDSLWMAAWYKNRLHFIPHMPMQGSFIINSTLEIKR